MKRDAAGFTLIEQLVVLRIIAVIAAILFPVLSKVRESGRATSCLSNLRQLGAASLMYAQDHDESFAMSRLPDETYVPVACTGEAVKLSGLEGTRNTWKRAVCKEGEWQLRPRRLPEIREPSKLLLLLESRFGFSDLGSWALAKAPNDDPNLGGLHTHNGATNFVFADGHAGRLKVPTTCTQELWLDGQPDPDDFYKTGKPFPEEYR